MAVASAAAASYFLGRPLLDRCLRLIYMFCMDLTDALLGRDHTLAILESSILYATRAHRCTGELPDRWHVPELKLSKKAGQKVEKAETNV